MEMSEADRRSSIDDDILVCAAAWCFGDRVSQQYAMKYLPTHIFRGSRYGRAVICADRLRGRKVKINTISLLVEMEGAAGMAVSTPEDRDVPAQDVIDEMSDDGVLRAANDRATLEGVAIPRVIAWYMASRLHEELSKHRTTLAATARTATRAGIEIMCADIRSSIDSVMSLESPGHDAAQHVRESAVAVFNADAGTKSDPRKNIGVLSGVPCIDRLMHGARDGQMVVVAARLKEGKTTLATQWALNGARDFVKSSSKKKVLIVSYELTRFEINRKMIYQLAKVNPSAVVERGKMTQEEQSRFLDATKEFSAMPIYTIGNEPPLGIDAVCGTICRMASTADLGLVVIDYAQIALVPDSVAAQGRQAAVSYVSDAVRRTAVTAKVPIILVAQLGRPSKYADDPPTPADLQWSDRLGQDAHAMVLLHRAAATPPPVRGIGQIDAYVWQRVGRSNVCMTLDFDYPHGWLYDSTNSPRNGGG